MPNQKNNRFPQKKKSKLAAGDDRNLVLVDDDFQDADFEDRAWLFWQRHGSKTIVSAVAVFLAIIAVIVYIEVGKMSLASLQTEYATAETAEQKLAFAEANANTPLAGTAFFAVGSEFADAGKHAQAAQAFGNAARVFSDKKEFSAMHDRALIAQAASLARTSEPNAAKDAQAMLKKLAGTIDANPIYRGQAMYELASIALAANNLDEARLWLNEMDRALDPTNVWQMRKRFLTSIEPNLAKKEIVPIENTRKVVPAQES